MKNELSALIIGHITMCCGGTDHIKVSTYAATRRRTTCQFQVIPHNRYRFSICDTWFIEVFESHHIKSSSKWA
jgi:hypothetical protein